MGVASASSPEGPWEDSGQPLVYTPGMGEIDPDYFMDSDGSAYLIWKSGKYDIIFGVSFAHSLDGNAIGQPTPIWAQPLDATGTVLMGTRTMLITDTLRMVHALFRSASYTAASMGERHHRGAMDGQA